MWISDQVVKLVVRSVVVVLDIPVPQALSSHEVLEAEGGGYILSNRVRHLVVQVLYQLIPEDRWLKSISVWLRHNLLSFSIASVQISHISNPELRQFSLSNPFNTAALGTG